jgi:porin
VPLNSYVFELNAHLQVVSAIAFEPVVQYLVHPNDFYNPYSARRARDGVYVGGTLVVPIGVMLGLAKL